MKTKTKDKVVSKLSAEQLIEAYNMILEKELTKLNDELRKRGSYAYINNYQINNHMCTICTISQDETSYLGIRLGYSITSTADTFNPTYGRVVALGRALKAENNITGIAYLYKGYKSKGVEWADVATESDRFIKFNKQAIQIFLKEINFISQHIVRLKIIEIEKRHITVFERLAKKI